MTSSRIEKIIEAKEIIGDEAAVRIAEHYNIEKFDTKNLKGCCPFHEEKTPSFIWNQKDKYYKCFSCGKRLGLLDMYVDTEGTYTKAVKKLLDEAGVKYTPDILRDEVVDRSDFFKNYRFPTEEKIKLSGVAEEYCLKRGISKDTLSYLDIRQDTHNNIVFELKDVTGKLLASKYRPSHAIQKDEPKMWWQKGTSTCPILYNIQRIDTTQPLVVVEGYWDCASVIEAGYKNVVSIPSGAEDLNWIEFNYDFLENFDEIILWYDNDSAGQRGVKNVISRLGEYRCKIVKPDEDNEQAVIKYYNSLGIKKQINKTDANNVLLASGPAEIISLLNNAEYIPVKNLKYLMDCEVRNVMDIEKFSTTISALDDILYGNLESCFTIYTGPAGDGKSSLANIATIISAVENNKKVMVFSGELEEGQVLDWIISPLAGVNHIEQLYSEGFKRSFHKVTPHALERIKEFYHENIIIYSSENELDTSGPAIIEAMTMAYKRFGCSVFLIDNLMCIDFSGLGDDSKWDSQKKFIVKLMNFTNQYSVSTNLVLHPKKPAPGQTTNSVYDLHGASEIGNLCHRLLWLRRDKKFDDSGELGKSIIEVIKDRPSQMAGRKCEIYYDKRTRRIFSNEAELFKKYCWEVKTPVIQYPIFINDKLLCNLTPLDLSPIYAEADSGEPF